MVTSQLNIRPVFDVHADVQGRDLYSRGAATSTRCWRRIGPMPRRRMTVTLSGQVETMRESYTGLFTGIALAIVLVYLFLVMNFQSWIDPLIVLMAVPFALGGVLWMLFLTQTPMSVPALMGTLMCIGLTTANSILVVSFANQRMAAGDDALRAATSAGYTRLRPVLMTAGAMILGMVPMALGIGEGGEQNAPLGRAVIGGLLFATFATLIFVPTMYRLLRRQPAAGDHPAAKVPPMQPHDLNQDRRDSEFPDAVSRASMATCRRSSTREPASAPNECVAIAAAVCCWICGCAGAALLPRARRGEGRGSPVFGGAAGGCGHGAAGAAGQDLVLPGQTAAWYETTIYARVNGYVAKWLVDIGDHVKKGQVLATIETPELDAELAAARAQLKASEAQVARARRRPNSAKPPTSAGAIRRRAWCRTRSANPRRRTTRARRRGCMRAEAQVALDRSRVDQYSALAEFKQVKAPFDGTITERKIDVGNLVTAGSSSTTTPLYRMAQTDPLRVFVDVPQSAAGELMNAGVPARDSRHGRRRRRVRRARSRRSAEAINAQARTMRVEVDMPNADHALVPGMYVNVAFRLRPAAGRSARGRVDIPRHRHAGRACGCGRQGSICRRRDRARQRQLVELASGAKPGDRLVLNISSQIAAGQTVAVNGPWQPCASSHLRSRPGGLRGGAELSHPQGRRAAAVRGGEHRSGCGRARPRGLVASAERCRAGFAGRRAVKSNLDLAVALDRLQRRAPTRPWSSATHCRSGCQWRGRARHRQRPGPRPRATGTGLGRQQQRPGAHQHPRRVRCGLGARSVRKFRREFEAARADTDAARAARNDVLPPSSPTWCAPTSICVDSKCVPGSCIRRRGAARVPADRQHSLRARHHQRAGRGARDARTGHAEAQIAPVEAQVSAAQYALAVLIGEYPESLVQRVGEARLGTDHARAGGAGRAGRSAQAPARHSTSGAAARGGDRAHRRCDGESVPAGRRWSGRSAASPGLGHGARHGQAYLVLRSRRHLAAAGLRRARCAGRHRGLEARRARGVPQDDLERGARGRHVGCGLRRGAGSVGQIGRCRGGRPAGGRSGERALRSRPHRFSQRGRRRAPVLRSARSNMPQAQVAQGEDFVSLYKSLGGGWQNYQAVPPIRLPQPAVIAAFRRALSNSPQ